MRKLLLIPAAVVAVAAISITYQDVMDARFRRKYRLHPYWRTHDLEVPS